MRPLNLDTTKYKQSITNQTKRELFQTPQKAPKRSSLTKTSSTTEKKGSEPRPLKSREWQNDLAQELIDCEPLFSEGKQTLGQDFLKKISKSSFEAIIQMLLNKYPVYDKLFKSNKFQQLFGTLMGALKYSSKVDKRLLETPGAPHNIAASAGIIDLLLTLRNIEEGLSERYEGNDEELRKDDLMSDKILELYREFFNKEKSLEDVFEEFDGFGKEEDNSLVIREGTEENKRIEGDKQEQRMKLSEQEKIVQEINEKINRRTAEALKKKENLREVKIEEKESEIDYKQKETFLQDTLDKNEDNVVLYERYCEKVSKLGADSSQLFSNYEEYEKSMKELEDSEVECQKAEIKLREVVEIRKEKSEKSEACIRSINSFLPRAIEEKKLAKKLEIMWPLKNEESESTLSDALDKFKVNHDKVKTDLEKEIVNENRCLEKMHDEFSLKESLLSDGIARRIELEKKFKAYKEQSVSNRASTHVEGEKFEIETEFRKMNIDLKRKKEDVYNEKMGAGNNYEETKKSYDEEIAKAEKRIEEMKEERIESTKKLMKVLYKIHRCLEKHDVEIDKMGFGYI